MTELSKGGNAPLAASGQIRVSIIWQSAPGDLDVVAFALTARGKVPDDGWFLFFNQLQSPEGSLNLDLSSPTRAHFSIDLDALPRKIERCAFAAVVEDGGFQDVGGLEVRATVPGGEPLVYRDQGDFPGKALILAELYRHGGGWKFRAIGQGFSDGLGSLAEAYGVEVADEGQDRPPPPGSTPAPQPRSEPGPAPPPPAGEPAPVPPTGPVPPGDGRPSRAPLVVLLAVILLVLGVGGWWYLHNLPVASPPSPATTQDHRPDQPHQVESTSRGIAFPATTQDHRPDHPADKPIPTVAGECQLETDEIYARYHKLGENYARIRDLIATSDEVRRNLRRMTREAGFGCSERFLETNRQHIERLETLQLDGWMAENTQLNICAGQLNDTIEARIQTEHRNTVLQRLIDEADRGRALESDLTNIARELAYFRNKAQRLIEAFKANIEACDF
ncbi:MAG: TerD family protein [Candidatus Competibacteraceae bacterium]|nr:TerD family protein [Candidatus Competibacteraceae bacterium]